MEYIGLDISQELTSICVIDGAIICRGKCATDPDI
jgi:hypothetical protein